MSGPRMRCRIVNYDEAELYCNGCREWYPMTLEFWVRDKMSRCRACDRERARLYEARRRLDPEHRLRDINKSRRYRAYLAGVEPELVEVNEREWREQYNAKQRERRAAVDRQATAAERKRARNRAWMAAARARQRKAAA